MPSKLTTSFLTISMLKTTSLRQIRKRKNVSCISRSSDRCQSQFLIPTIGPPRYNTISSINSLMPRNKLDEVSFNTNQSGRFQEMFFSDRFTFLLFQRQLRMYSDDRYADKDYAYVSGDFQGCSMKKWEVSGEKSKLHHCILLHRQRTGQVLGYEVRKNLFNNYTIEGGDMLIFKHKVQQLCLHKGYVVCSQGKNIYVYKNVQQQIQEQYSNKNHCLCQSINKNKYLLLVVCQFTQHKSRVIHISATRTGMVVSIDKEYKVYITQIHSGRITVYNYFQLRSTCFEEKIVNLILHDYGFIIIRTNYQRILVFTLLGDKVIDQILYFKKDTVEQSTEKMQTMHLWNNDLFELVVGTNRGNLWKIDLFALRQLQEVTETEVWVERLYLNKDGFRKEGIASVAIRRIGRHFLTLAFGQNHKLYFLKSNQWDEVRKSSLIQKSSHK